MAASKRVSACLVLCSVLMTLALAQKSPRELKEHPHASPISDAYDPSPITSEQRPTNLLFWRVEASDHDVESLYQYFAGIFDMQRQPLYNITCVLAPGNVPKSIQIRERDNFKIVSLVAEDFLTSEAGLIVLDDLKQRKFDVALFRLTSKTLVEDSKALDYIGATQVILSPDFEPDSLQKINSTPLQKQYKLFNPSQDLDAATLSYSQIQAVLEEQYQDFEAQISQPEELFQLHTKLSSAEPTDNVAAGYTVDGLRQALQVPANEVAFYPIVPTQTRYVTEDMTWQYKNSELYDFMQKKPDLILVQVATGDFTFRKITQALKNANSTETGLIFVANGQYVLIEEEMPKMLVMSAENTRKILSQTAVFVTDCNFKDATESLYYGTPILGLPQTPEQRQYCERLEQMGVARVNKDDKVPTDLTPMLDLIRSGSDPKTVKQIGSRMLFEEVRGKQDVRHYVDHFAKFGASHLQSPAHDLNFVQRYDLDIKCFVCLILLGVISLLWLVLSTVVKSLKC